LDFKPLSLPPVITGIVRIVQHHGGRIFLVGGPVRDLLLNRVCPDWDIAIDLGEYQTRARLEDKLRHLLRQFCQKFNARFVFHPHFLTATLTLPEQQIDICHTREETYPRPALLPLVKPAPLERDLFRRDFTMNAIALELTARGTGALIDPCNGQQDIKLRLVRIIHPQSFIDDPTRIFRAIRFAVRLDYEIESGTLYLMRAAIKNGYPALLTPERILYEIRCILKERTALKMLEALIKEKVLQSAWQWQPSPEILSRLQLLQNQGADLPDLFAYLLASFPVTEKFSLTREERETRQALANFNAVKRKLRLAKRPSTIYHLLKNLPDRALRIAALIEPDTAIREKITYYLANLKNRPALVTASDLLRIGIKPGRKLGTILQKLFALQLDRTSYAGIRTTRKTKTRSVPERTAAGSSNEDEIRKELLGIARRLTRQKEKN